MALVMIDAGHGGSDPGAVYNGRTEKDDNLSLALKVGEILQNNGVNVDYTRTTDIYDSPLEKANKANQSGADYFVSIHRNSSENPNVYDGSQVLVFADSGKRAELARNIEANLANVGFKDLGIDERPNLVVLKRTKMPAVLVEAGFINSDKDNQIYDEKNDEVAKAIADGILKTLGKNSNENLYKVQVGAYWNKSYADRMLNRLRSDGIDGYILYQDGLYKVLVGAYRYFANAIEMERRLRLKGYDTFISVGKDSAHSTAITPRRY